MSEERVLLSKGYELEGYDRLVRKIPESMIYHTREYVDFIAGYLDAEPFYLALKEGDRVIGLMPIVLKRNVDLGNIINSNPYYGSYGGVLADPDLPPMKKRRVKRLLFEFLKDFALEHDCVLSTIIASPFDRDQTFYFNNLSFNYWDWRVAQVTLIPLPGERSIRETLFQRFSSSCRRTIRKAEKLGVKVGETVEKGEVLDEFYRIYRENMESIGASVKKKSFFERALDAFPKGVCTLRYGELNGEIIGGIFQFYYKDIIEYYQPAISHDQRGSGATNLLVFNGMMQGAREGYSYWNFGGTWKTLENLYRFKRSFGAVDFVYYYFITAYEDVKHIKELEPSDLAREYPGFYVIPFSELGR